MLAWLLACQGADAPVVERTVAPPPAPSASNTTDVVPLPALDPIPAPVVVHTFIGGRVMLSAPDGTWQFSLFPDEQGLAIFDDVQPDSFVTVYLPVGGPLLRTVAGVYPGDELWIVDPPRPYQQEGTGVMDIEVSKPSDELSIGGFFTEGCGTMWAWTLPLARRWPVAEECIVNGTIDALATASTEDRVEGAVAFKLGVPVEGRAPDRYVSLVLDEWNLNPGIVEVTYPALEAEPAFVTAWLSGGRTGGPGNAVGIPSAQGQAVNGVLAVDDRFYDQASVDVRWTQYDADATRDILRTWVINDMPPDGTRTTVAVTPEDRPELLGSPGFDLAARTLTPDWSGRSVWGDGLRSPACGPARDFRERGAVVVGAPRSDGTVHHLSPN